MKQANVRIGETYLTRIAGELREVVVTDQICRENWRTHRSETKFRVKCAKSGRPLPKDRSAAALRCHTVRPSVREIYTDEHGRPIPRPCRENFQSNLAFIRAFHAYKDRITAVANAAFDDQFKRSVAK